MAARRVTQPYLLGNCRNHIVEQCGHSKWQIKDVESKTFSRPSKAAATANRNFPPRHPCLLPSYGLSSGPSTYQDMYSFHNRCEQDQASWSRECSRSVLPGAAMPMIIAIGRTCPRCSVWYSLAVCISRSLWRCALQSTANEPYNVSHSLSYCSSFLLLSLLLFYRAVNFSSIANAPSK
jgi:hypothetical protein